MTEREGTYTIPTRLFLNGDQRAKLEHLVRSGETDVADLVTRVISEYLDTMPEPKPSPVEVRDRRADIRQRRAELARLRARREAAGNAAPVWLNTYIADLEAEIRRLE